MLEVPNKILGLLVWSMCSTVAVLIALRSPSFLHYVPLDLQLFYLGLIETRTGMCANILDITLYASKLWEEVVNVKIINEYI